MISPFSEQTTSQCVWVIGIKQKSPFKTTFQTIFRWNCIIYLFFQYVSHKMDPLRYGIHGNMCIFSRGLQLVIQIFEPHHIHVSHIYIYIYVYLVFWFTNNSICLRFTYLSICWCTYLLIHIFICLFMYLFVYSFDNSFFVTQCGWSFMSRGRWNSDSSPSRGLWLLLGFFLC